VKGFSEHGGHPPSDNPQPTVTPASVSGVRRGVVHGSDHINVRPAPVTDETIIAPPVQPWKPRRPGERAGEAKTPGQPTWAERDELLLLLKEIQESRPTSERYLRDSLRLAKQSLAAAYKAVTGEAQRLARANDAGADARAAAVRETVRALADETAWRALLTAHDLGASEDAQRAVSRLAQAIGQLNGRDRVEPDFAALLRDIGFLRSEVDRVAGAVNTTPHAYVQDLIDTSRTVGAQVAIATAASSFQDQLAGVSPMPDVIYAGLGLAVASAVAQLYRKVSQRLAALTVPGQFKQLHRELISALQQLNSFLPWLARSTLPLASALDTLRNVHLGTTFLVSRLDQLAVRALVLRRDDYRTILKDARSALGDIHLILTENSTKHIPTIRTKLNGVIVRLEQFHFGSP